MRAFCDFNNESERREAWWLIGERGDSRAYGIPKTAKDKVIHECGSAQRPQCVMSEDMPIRKNVSHSVQLITRQRALYHPLHGQREPGIASKGQGRGVKQCSTQIPGQMKPPR